MINPSIKPIPPLDQAQADQRAAVEALENSQKNNEPYPVQRTLECTLIGANKRLRIAEEGEVGMQGYQTLFPFEIMVFGIGSARIATFPCEIFFHTQLKIKKESPAERTYLAFRIGMVPAAGMYIRRRHWKKAVMSRQCRFMHRKPEKKWWGQSCGCLKNWQSNMNV